jgi:hypothetical protein
VITEREAYEWQQEIGYALGNRWGAQVLTLEECIEKIRELKRIEYIAKHPSRGEIRSSQDY